MAIVLNLTRTLIGKLEDYLNAISEGLLVYQQGIQEYLSDDLSPFEERLTQIDHYESRADELRREIENHLYTHSLIPENRGDVLGLLEHLDDVIDAAKETLIRFSIETPDIPMELDSQFRQLAERCIQCGEAVVAASRAFFTDVSRVQESIHKVYFYEKEADTVSDRLKRRVFKMDMKLSWKMHLRDLVDAMDQIADSAEGVADRLSIYAIKRSM